MFNGIYSGIGNMFKGILGGVLGDNAAGQFGPYISSCSLCCCCIIIIIIVIAVAVNSSGGMSGGAHGSISSLSSSNYNITYTPTPSFSMNTSVTSPIYRKYDFV